MTDLPRGIDVSSYQGDPDWDAVKASGIDFAFIKATEGDREGYFNPTFGRSWSEARRVGIVRGAYHFARPGAFGGDAEEEADWFLRAISNSGGLAPGDLLALDLESGDGDLGPWVLAFLRRVESVVGFKPLVYTGLWFSSPHGLTLHPELAEYGLWQAAYQADMPAPLAPWSFIAFWQHSDKGSVPGISGPVDLNVFNGPLERLNLYGMPAPIVAAPDPRDARIAELETSLNDTQARLSRVLAALRVEAARIEGMGL